MLFIWYLFQECFFEKNLLFTEMDINSEPLGAFLWNSDRAWKNRETELKLDARVCLINISFSVLNKKCKDLIKITV